ncbi:MAG: chaperone NapD [Azonexus sp.]|jgi:nitrate reductase NapD|uniref:chaperone NapD n=1 Tax=Azonexus sp. TaxID=1872668 RepID=UPI002832C149|nr:chaperone NapD [Azonexus sp.]MDR0777306.1 chaperone NapD [Azonexus sp.]
MDLEASPGIHISSVIVSALPAQSADVQRALAELPGVEVHTVAADGRMIVSIESVGDDVTLSHFETIRQLPGVLAASLVYHQYETDPDEEA